MAIVVSRDVDYGVTRMFEMSNSERLPVEVHAFFSLSEAENWVSTDSKWWLSQDAAPRPRPKLEK